jgi:hypothetical protein
VISSVIITKDGEKYSAIVPSLNLRIGPLTRAELWETLEKSGVKSMAYADAIRYADRESYPRKLHIAPYPGREQYIADATRPPKDRFILGPMSFQDLQSALKEKGFTEEEIKEATKVFTHYLGRPWQYWTG